MQNGKGQYGLPLDVLRKTHSRHLFGTLTNPIRSSPSRFMARKKAVWVIPSGLV